MQSIIYDSMTHTYICIAYHISRYLSMVLCMYNLNYSAPEQKFLHTKMVLNATCDSGKKRKS